MKYLFTGKNLTVKDDLKDLAYKKLGKFEKFFSEDTEVHVVFSYLKNYQIVEATIRHGALTLRAEAKTDDMMTSMEKVANNIARQLRKNKTRLEKRIHSGGYLSPDFVNYEVDDVEEEGNYTLVKTKKFEIKPMDLDEAILQMNLIGHEFFVFVNSETNQTSVVYKRKSGDYGLLEPQ